ncbi:hypothetical protein EHR01_06450 [Leptospira mtsangambouensis]|uniref:SIR2-like domain-containing protein n=1 Tax=Leptospira mtsangambouensis TaxID=2484912 RepID=A0ABY2P4L5_9LEPT|nr:SIR2 family protein [Leptospira mtsangambouensis]TGM82416.1 hypothetical protein EHR01_06450 [Leptospira mtsangambouensis]
MNIRKKILFLGAGFSAPLDIPTMANFLERSHDLHELDPFKYKSFEVIFELIKKLHYIKSKININLNNIESILSLLEMGDYLSDKIIEGSEFEKFIKDVIIGSTKTIEFNQHYLHKNLKGEHNNIFQDRILDVYFQFILRIIGAKFKIYNRNNKILFDVSKDESNNNKYQIITLNYDNNIEEFIKLINSNSENKIKIDYENQIVSELNLTLSIAKLHGSIESRIIPPTWNKTANDQIKIIWQNAFNMLNQAHEIIFLGYSLPESDAYIKYLITYSMLNNQNLKKVTVYNNDSDINVKNRYDQLFESTLENKYSYNVASVTDFFKQETKDYVTLNHENSLSKTYGMLKT